VTPVITGTAGRLHLTYDPAADFGWLQVVDVTVNASDLAGTPCAGCLFLHHSGGARYHTALRFGAQPGMWGDGGFAEREHSSACPGCWFWGRPIEHSDEGRGGRGDPGHHRDAADYTLTYDPAADFGWLQSWT